MLIFCLAQFNWKAKLTTLKLIAAKCAHVIETKNSASTIYLHLFALFTREKMSQSHVWDSLHFLDKQDEEGRRGWRGETLCFVAEAKLITNYNYSDFFSCMDLRRQSVEGGKLFQNAINLISSFLKTPHDENENRKNRSTLFSFNFPSFVSFAHTWLSWGGGREHESQL